MRKQKIIEHISLDGVIQHSADDGGLHASDWTAPYRTPASCSDAETNALSLIERVSATLTAPPKLEKEMKSELLYLTFVTVPGVFSGCHTSLIA